MRNIKAILKDANAGKPIKPHEKELLDKEMPGHDRARAAHDAPVSLAYLLRKIPPLDDS